MWKHGLVRSVSGYGQVTGTCKRGNKLSGSIKRGEFLDYLLKKDPVQWSKVKRLMNN